MFRRAREHLQRLRGDRAAWSTIAYEPYHDEQDDQFDRNESAREAVLLALQLDRRPEDAALLRFILEQEVLYHEDSELQGLMPALPRACFLVGSLRAPEDVWWLVRAKTANFDTQCGLSRELLLGAGIAGTIAYVRASGRDDAEVVIEELFGEQAQVDAYWRVMVDEYPQSAEAMHPLTFASHAEDQEEPGEGVAALERWLARAPEIAEAEDRTVAIDARWAEGLVSSLRSQTEDAGLLARLDAVAAGIAALRAT